MRLINVDTLRLEDFRGGQYAILSHTWGDAEVTYQDFQNLAIASHKAGFRKICLACRQAKVDGLQYAW